MSIEKKDLKVSFRLGVYRKVLLVVDTSYIGRNDGCPFLCVFCVILYFMKSKCYKLIVFFIKRKVMLVRVIY